MGDLHHLNFRSARFGARHRSVLPWLLLSLLAAVPWAAGAQNFVATGALIEARSRHTATLLLDGRVLVTGGNSGGLNASRTAELYDPATRGWTATGRLTVERESHTATRLLDGRVLVVGGRNGFGRPVTSELFDPATGTWQETGPVSRIRFGSTVTLMPNGKILLAGGGDASAELFNPTTGQWGATGTMTSSRDGHTATLLPDGKVLVAGGYRPSAPFNLASMELYDPTTGQWAETTPMTTDRQGHEALLLPGDRILFRGGRDGGQRLVPAGIFQLATQTWSSAENPAVGSNNFDNPATALADGRMLVAGGRLAGFGFVSFYDTALVLDLATARWSAGSVGKLNTARTAHTATRLLNGQVLIAGGEGKSGFLASAELFGEPTGNEPGIRLTVPVRLPTGALQFEFQGPPGTSFVGFGTGNLSVPFANWEALGDAIEVSPGRFRFTDPQPPKIGARFYRAGIL